MSTRLAAFATAHGVVDRVHDNAAVARTAAEVTAATGLTADFEVVLGVGDDADGGTARLEDHAHLARGHLNDGILAVARHELRVCASGTHQLGALSRTKLYVVDKGSKRNLGERKGVAYFRGDAVARHDGLADLYALRGHNVAFLAIGIEYESDARAAVRVVLDCLYRRGDSVFVSFEVDDTVKFLVSAANVALGHLALVVASARFSESVNQAFFRLRSGDVVIGNDQFMTLAGSCGFNLF